MSPDPIQQAIRREADKINIKLDFFDDLLNALKAASLYLNAITPEKLGYRIAETIRIAETMTIERAEHKDLTPYPMALDVLLRRTAANARLCAHVMHLDNDKLTMEGFAKEVEFAAELAVEVLRGEFICKKCGIRKDADASGEF